MESNPDTDCRLSVRTVLFIISGTVNVIIVVYLFINVSLATVSATRRRLKAKRPFPPEPVPECTEKYIGCLATIFTDLFGSLIVFGGGLYLLINGAMVQPFIIRENQSCQLAYVTTGVSAAAIGRLCAAAVMGLRRMRAFDTPKMAGKCSRQLLEHVFAIALMAVLLPTNEALLTRALICIMSVDHSLCCLAWMIQTHSSSQSNGLVKSLKVVQCFLAMAFRGAVPLVCLAVSVSAFDADVLAMTTQSVVVFAAFVVAYLFGNTWLIVTSTRQVWLLYSGQTPNKQDGKPSKKVSRANNQRSPKAKTAPLEFRRNDIGENGSGSCSKCNANRGLQQVRCQCTGDRNRTPAGWINGVGSRYSSQLRGAQCHLLTVHNPTTHNIAQSRASASPQSNQVNKANLGIASSNKRHNTEASNQRSRFLDTIQEEAESLSSSG